MKLGKDLVSEFEKLVTNSMEAYDAQGVAVSVFGPEDTYYENFFGYRDTDAGLGVNADTIFGMASISKSFTCLALLQLVEKGIVDIEGLVSDYVPEFTGRNQKGLKVWHLMCHSGGFYPEKRILAKDVAEEIGILDSVDSDIAYNEELAKEGIKRIAERLDSRAKLIGKSGELMSYSNDSYGIISDIVRTCGGYKTIAEYLNNEVIMPLGMARTSMEFEAPAKDENCTQLYIKRDNVLTWSKDFYDNALVLMGGGALKSTVNDIKKYTKMYLGNGMLKDGTRLLSSNLINEMCKPRQFDGFQRYYGYGLTTKFIKDITVLGHGGGLTGVANMFQWSPELECGFIVFCNTTGFPAAAITNAATNMALGISPGEPVDKYVDEPWREDMIRAAIGSYKSDEGSVYEVSYDNGKLCVLLDGKELETRQVRKDMLVVERPYSSSEIIFNKNTKGEVWSIRTGSRLIAKEV